MRLRVYAVWLKYSVLLEEGQVRTVPLVFPHYVAFRLFTWLTERLEKQEMLEKLYKNR